MKIKIKLAFIASNIRVMPLAQFCCFNKPTVRLNQTRSSDERKAVFSAKSPSQLLIVVQAFIVAQ